jgi:hypothetical protein
MLKALALVRNLNSSASGLDFGEFTINPVGPRFNELRQVFSSLDVNPDDWIFERVYSQADSLVEAIRGTIARNHGGGVANASGHTSASQETRSSRVERY